MLHRIALIVLAFSLALTAQTPQPSPTKKSTTQKSTAKKAAPAAKPTAILHTTAGDLKCELFPDQAPKTVANFIGLAKGTKPWKDPLSGKMVHGKPLYDGVIFHRVIPGFMIQGGDPTGTGSGDVGFEFADELHADLLFDQPGRLAMANRGPNTNSSQFFITETPQPFLNPCLDEGGCLRGGRQIPKGAGYTIFGQCDDASVQLVKKIAQGPCRGKVCDGTNSRADNAVKLTHVEIVSGSGAAKPSARKTPAAKTAPVKPNPAPSPGK